MKRSKEWSIYMLLCSNGTYYTGITTDIHRRLKQHRSGCGSKYVAAHLPCSLVYLGYASRSRSWALKLERKWKKMKHKDKKDLAAWYEQTFIVEERKSIVKILSRMR